MKWLFDRKRGLGRGSVQQHGNWREDIAQIFSVPFYESRNPDVVEAGIDPIAHYLDFGWREGREPAPWFDSTLYLRIQPELTSLDMPAFVHFGRSLRNGDGAALAWLRGELILPLPDGRGKVVHTAFPRPLASTIKLLSDHVDKDYYWSRRPDLRAAGTDPVLHYILLGWKEGMNPSAGFSTEFYLSRNPDIREAGINPLLHYLEVRHKEEWRQVASVVDAAIFNEFDDIAMKQRVAAAVALDPMVALPDQPRRVTFPPLQYGALGAAAEAMRTAVGPTPAPVVVLLPHVRMSGAARVAGELTRALAGIDGTDRLLVVTTEEASFEYPDWFPEGIRLLDLSAFREGLEPEWAMRLLFDLLRGVGARQVFNVNSRLAWDTLRVYGRQIAQECLVASYLFTWDESPRGARVGYPIQWLRDTVDHHDLILCDTARLADEIRARFALDGPDAARVTTLYTPAPEPTPERPASDAGAPQQAADGVPKRVLWAGRFDRQKRVDLLIAIARQMPEVEFRVYGKPVLDDTPLAAGDPPPNLLELGTFTRFDEALDPLPDVFLYTAQWDGMPTILLDAAGARLPIVAADVGGIAELVGPETGWLVAPFDDVEGYVAALRAALSDPADAARRATALQARIAAMMNRPAYARDVAEARTAALALRQATRTDPQG